MVGPGRNNKVDI